MSNNFCTWKNDIKDDQQRCFGKLPTIMWPGRGTNVRFLCSHRFGPGLSVCVFSSIVLLRGEGGSMLFRIWFQAVRRPADLTFRDRQDRNPILLQWRIRSRAQETEVHASGRDFGWNGRAVWHIKVGDGVAAIKDCLVMQIQGMRIEDCNEERLLK